MTDRLQILRKALREGRPRTGNLQLPETPEFDYAVDRLLKAWEEGGAFGPDQAVLLRQVIRWSKISQLDLGPVGNWLEAHADVLSKSGISWLQSGQASASPFIPDWLRESSPCDDPPEERVLPEQMPAESYVASIGYKEGWRSPAQKEAAWTVLTTLPGATKIIALPTGAGKSLCFQLLPRFSSGLTLVIVPTIALAMDQRASAVKRLGKLPGINPLFFSAGDDSKAARDDLRNRRTRLIFASPEACVSGSLRETLDKHASDGWLENLVLDEAHLVQTWGAQFRVEFQVLAAKRTQWLAASKSRLRTFLFSATMTKECRRLLGELFCPEGKAEEFITQRFRPETKYFSREFISPSKQKEAVIEALWHMPRPAILYVTEKDEAEDFYRLLKESRFARIGCFHGDTSQTERLRLLTGWKEDKIDLMVATSAFGVGVDKGDVRAVIHACYPENLDRYYQEVGRGGRDGWSCTSILMPTPKDRKTADGLCVKLLKPDKIQERWDSMFANKKDSGGYLRYLLPLSVRRIGLVGVRTFNENVQWNKRLLLQLQRAKRLKLIDLKVERAVSRNEDPEEWAEVEVINFQPNTRRLGSIIAAERQEERDEFLRGQGEVEQLLSQSCCAARIISSVYKIDASQRACGGCPWCRKHDYLPRDCHKLEYPHSELSDQAPSGQMVEHCHTPVKSSVRADFVDLIYRCVMKKGLRLRQFFVPREHADLVLSCFNEAFPNPRTINELYRVDSIEDCSGISPFASRPLVFIHINKLSPRGIEIGRNCQVVHLLCGIANPTDPRTGRHVGMAANCTIWHSPAKWLLET